MDTGIEQVSVKRAIEEMKKPLRYEFIGDEKEFETAIFEDIDEICERMGLPNIVVKERQKRIDACGFYIKPDILVRHDDGSMTVFEVKKANEKFPASGTSNQMNAVGQLLLYGNVIGAVINAPVRLALIDNKIYYRTYCAFIGNYLPITLIEYQNGRVFVPYMGWTEYIAEKIGG